MHELAASARSAPASDDRIGVLVVGGHRLVRWALWRITDESPDMSPVGEAATAADAQRMVGSQRPNVVVIDCSLDAGAGWRLARDLRDRDADLGIVVLSTDGSDDSLFRALDSGASAYLANVASVREVAAAIRHAAVSASSFSAAGLAQALRRRQETAQRMALSGREQQVLTLLKAGRSVPEVAATMYVSVSTAKTYVARLYDKLGANNRAQALMAAVELGLFDLTPAAV